MVIKLEIVVSNQNGYKLERYLLYVLCMLKYRPKRTGCHADTLSRYNNTHCYQVRKSDDT